MSRMTQARPGPTQDVAGAHLQAALWKACRWGGGRIAAEMPLVVELGVVTRRMELVFLIRDFDEISNW